MPPDLNSLPGSPSPPFPAAASYRRSSVSNHTGDRSPSLSSLQAAAAINAGLHRTNSNASPARAANSRLERRRSSLMTNLLINDPSMPSPGEIQHPNGASHNGSPRSRRASSLALNTADPNHHRQPSLGELHQELECENEAQVNRLLHMIRIQQDQLLALQRGQPDLTSSDHHSTSAIVDQSPQSASSPNAPHTHSYFSRPNAHSRHSSARQSITGNTTSRGTSPAALRPVSGGLGPRTEDFLLGGTRDDSAFYQAETQMLTRENQMLKARIRELERSMAELTTGSPASAAPPHSNSPLANAPAAFSSEPTPAIPAPID